MSLADRNVKLHEEHASLPRKSDTSALTNMSRLQAFVSDPTNGVRRSVYNSIAIAIDCRSSMLLSTVCLAGAFRALRLWHVASSRHSGGRITR